MNKKNTSSKLPWQRIQQLSFILTTTNDSTHLFQQIGKMIDNLIPSHQILLLYQKDKDLCLGFSLQKKHKINAIIKISPDSIFDWVKKNRQILYNEKAPQHIHCPKHPFLLAPILHLKYPYTTNILGLLYLSKKDVNYNEDEKNIFIWIMQELTHSFNNYLLYQAATKDFLTGAYLRGYFLEYLQQRIFQITPTTNLSILMLDIDFFKKINDSYGHLAGDILLKNLVQLLQNSLRETDLLCRYGGEEFAIFLENTSYSDALYIAEKIRIQISKHIFIAGKHRLKMTVSIGVSEIKHLETLEKIIFRVDSALFQAKNKGRNCIC